MQRIKQSQTGVTLIELLIVVLLIGVIAMFAIPGYQNQVERSARTSAQGEMIDFVRAMETFRSQNMSYQGATVANLAPQLAANNYYAVNLDIAANNQSFVLRAVPRANTVVAGTGTMAVDNRARTCWAPDSDNPCDLDNPPRRFSD